MGRFAALLLLIRSKKAKIYEKLLLVWHNTAPHTALLGTSSCSLEREFNT
jgi:hypothetical protein